LRVAEKRHRDPEVKRDLQGRPDLLALQDLPVHREQRDRKGLPDHRVLPVSAAKPVLPARKGK
jgi:hypothetical protein